MGVGVGGGMGHRGDRRAFAGTRSHKAELLHMCDMSPSYE